MISEWLSKTRSFFSGKSRSAVDEELQFHIDRETEANIAAGMTPAEARRRAVIAFGGRERAREQAREARPSWALESWLRDFRYGLRGLARNPVFAAVAILTLALAIGANTTIFSLLDQALLRTLPVTDPQQLVVLDFTGSANGHTQSHGGNTPGHHHEFSYPMYKDLRDKNTVLSGLIATAPTSVGVTWNKRGEAVSAEMVSGNYFSVLGVQPAVGRVFAESDETAPGQNPVAVLNFDFWKNHLAEAPVIGQTLLVNGTPFTVVGVAAPGFQSAEWGALPALYVPITEQKIVEPEWNYLADHKSYWIDLVGRLRPDVSRAKAEASLSILFRELRTSEFGLLDDQSPKARQDFIGRSHLNLVAGAKGFSPMRNDAFAPLTIIMGMVLLVIAMAVVNVASLLLVRAATRAREFSVRYALGATSGQVLRQLLAEGLLLGIAGAVLGVALVPQALRLLIHWMSPDSPGGQAFSPTLNWPVLAFTVAITLIASLLFSLAPAMQFWNPKLSEELHQGRGAAGGSLRFRRTSVALQIGFSLLLIVGAGLFVRTIDNLRNVNPGFATDHLLQFNLAPEMAGYSSTQVPIVEQHVLDTLAALPGMRSVGATNDPDLAGDDREGDVKVSGYTPPPNDDYDVELPWVSDSYLQTLGIPLIAGRYFNSADTATSDKVAIVNETFAKHFFGTPAAALGHHVSRPNRPTTTDAVIVGVVRDAKHSSLRDPAMPTDYILFSQAERTAGLVFYVRTWAAPNTAMNSIRAAIAGIDSKLIVDKVITMRQQIDDDLVAERAVATLSMIFGILAAMLAGIGLYGILAYSTAQRTREIGIRMALGARRTTVVGLILREVLMLAGGAVVVTIPLAILATHAVRSQLFGVPLVDPLVYAAGIFAIVLVAGLSAFLPARRAATVDPASALRTD